MLFVVPVVLFDMLKAKQLACVSESGQKCPAARSLSLRRAWIEIPASSRRRGNSMSLSLRRAWIEISRLRARLPYHWSLSLRRAWIEIHPNSRNPDIPPSLSLRRAWIEITSGVVSVGTGRGRSPYGERGLKYLPASSFTRRKVSLSLRRAWIEMRSSRGTVFADRVALLTESVD